MSGRAFVTGGSGYLGSHLIRFLLGEGYREVTTLVRGQTPLRHLPQIVKVCRGDLTAEGMLERIDAPKGRDVDVFHLVSLFVEPKGNTTTVEAIRRLVSYYGDSPPRRFIFFGNNLVYGDTGDDLPNEESPCRPHTVHGANKLEAERIAQSSGLPFTVLRISQVIGSLWGLGNSSFDWIVLRPVLEGRLPLVGGGKQRVDVVHVSDVLQAVRLVLEKDDSVGEIFNIGSGGDVTNRKIFHLIADEGGVRRPAEIPYQAALAFAWLAEKVSSALGLHPPVVPDMIRALFCNRRLSIEKARRYLGYQPEMTDTLRALREEYAEELHGIASQTI